MHGITFNDDQIPERFIANSMALELHKTLNTTVRPEVAYTEIVKQLKLVRTPQALALIGDLKADLVIYEDGFDMLPRAVIEIKKLSEGYGSINSVIADLRKGDPVALAEHVPVYAGVFICETDKSIEQIQRELEKAAGGRPVLFTDPPSPALVSGDWRWCFACVSYGPYTVEAAGHAA